MQMYLQDILKRHNYNMLFKKDIVLELMAGVGRNYDTLKLFFRHVEMIEQSPYMYKHIHRDVFVHKKLVQDFDYPVKFYDCVVGVWCFCYLNDAEMQKQTSFIK